MKNSNSLFVLLLLLVFSCKNEKGAETSSKATQQNSELNDLIKVENLLPGEKIASPLVISGKARGTWFFEGSFAIYLEDENGNESAVAIAQAQGDWMTEDWVNFSTILEFEKPASEKGVLIFEKANPTGKREFDDSFRIPVNFCE